jgi:hypothetical protein
MSAAVAALVLALGMSTPDPSPMRPSLTLEGSGLLSCTHYEARGFDGAVRRKRLHAYTCTYRAGFQMEMIGAYLTPGGREACLITGTLDTRTGCLTLERTPVRPQFQACGGPRWACCDDGGVCVGGDGTVPQ